MKSSRMPAEGSQERREMVFLMQKLLAVERNTFDEYSALVKYSLLLKMLRLLRSA